MLSGGAGSSFFLVCLFVVLFVDLVTQVPVPIMGLVKSLFVVFIVAQLCLFIVAKLCLHFCLFPGLPVSW